MYLTMLHVLAGPELYRSNQTANKLSLTIYLYDVIHKTCMHKKGGGEHT